MKKYYQIADNVVLRAFPRSSCESCNDSVNNIILFDYQEEPFEDENYDPMYCFACFRNSCEYDAMINLNLKLLKEFIVEYCKTVGNDEVLSKINNTDDESEIMELFEEIGWDSIQTGESEDEDYYEEDDEE